MTSVPPPETPGESRLYYGDPASALSPAEPGASRQPAGQAKEMPAHVRVARNGGAMIALAAVAILFCFVTGSRNGAPALISSPIAEAAQRTANADGAEFTMTESISISGTQSGSVSIQGTGALNVPDNTMKMSMTMQAPPRLGPTVFDVIFDGGDYYLSSALLTPALPSGKTWVKLSQLPGGAGVDLDGQLVTLEKVGSGVTRVGRERVRGVPTTHYHADIPLSELSDRMRSMGAGGAADDLNTAGPPMSADVWVDRHGLVRHCTMAISFSSLEGDSATVNVDMEFSHFGSSPQIVAPDDAATIDSSDLPDGSLFDSSS